jgi:hypothetical protein
VHDAQRFTQWPVPSPARKGQKPNLNTLLAITSISTNSPEQSSAWLFTQLWTLSDAARAANCSANDPGDRDLILL